MKISVITPTLNCRTTLSDTIESVISQDYRDVEMVIVDGGSVDGTLDVIKEYQGRHPRIIKWMSGKDTGVYQALNRGIRLSEGKIIGTLHSGDRFTGRDILSRVVDIMDSNLDIPYIYGDVRFVDPANGKIVRHYRGSSDIEKSLKKGIAPPHPSLFIRRSLLVETGLYKENYLIAADYDLFLRLALVKGLRGYYLPIDMVEMSTGGISTKPYNRLITNNREKIRALRENGISRHGLGVFRRYMINPFK